MPAKATIVLLSFLVDLSLFQGHLSGVAFASPFPHPQPQGDLYANGALSFEQRKAQLLAQNAAARGAQKFGGETHYINNVDEMSNVKGDNWFGAETEQTGNTYEKPEGVDQTYGSQTLYSGSAHKISHVTGSTHFGSKTVQKNNVYSS